MSKAYMKYKELVDVLNRLILEGKGDGAVADNIRDQIKVYWDKMTVEEHERAKEVDISKKKRKRQ